MTEKKEPQTFAEAYDNLAEAVVGFFNACLDAWHIESVIVWLLEGLEWLLSKLGREGK